MPISVNKGVLVILSAGLCGFVLYSGLKTKDNANMGTIVGVDFEVFGRVQGEYIIIKCEK